MNPIQVQASATNPAVPAAACGDNCASAVTAGVPGVHSRLLAQLEQTHSGPACQRIASALLEQANPEVVDALIAQACNTQGCRHEHLVLALRKHVAQATAGLARCLAHPQAGLRLAGVRLVEAIGTAPAANLLLDLLEQELDVEVCSAAVVALGECGDHRVVPVLRKLVRRFPGNTILAFDIDVAIGQIE